jgi:hypothetical protein
MVSLRPYRPEDAPALLGLFRDTIRRINSRDDSPAQIAAWASEEVAAALCRWYDARIDAPLGRQFMTATARHLLDAFEALTEADKHQVAVEILRRFVDPAKGDLPESALVEAADELFRTLDAEEAGHGPP